MPTRKIYTNTLAQIGAKVLTALISIVMIKILTNYLDIAGYGLYSKIYNYLSIFAVIADLGLYTITVREISSHAHDARMVERISGNVLALRTLSGVIIIALSLIIALMLPGYDDMTALIGVGIASVFTLAGLINSSLMSYLQATLRTEFSLVANTAGKLLTFGTIVMCVTFFASAAQTERFTLIMLAGLAGNILMTALTWWYASRHMRIRFLWERDYIIHIIRTSLPYGLALFLNVIFFKVDTILLSVMTPDDIADMAVALYALPMKLVEVGMMYGTIFLNSLLPVLTGLIERKEWAKYQKIVRHSLILLASGGAFWALILTFFADSILLLISSREYIETMITWYSSVDALRIVGWIFFVYFISSLYTYILIARGAERKMLTINAIVAIINIVGNIIFIPLYSFIGSAWVTLASQVLLLILTYTAVRSLTRTEK